MAKAILVLDEMPEYCNDCKIAIQDVETETFKCPLCPYYSYLWGAEIERPDGCPLHEMPPEAVPDNSDMPIMWNVGWNACRDELEGKRE